jgi:transaldolase
MPNTKPTTELHRAGQSLWLDTITRDMISDGTLLRYIEDLAITGLTSNPTIYQKAIAGTDAYDEQISDGHELGLPDDDIYFELAVSDLQRAADALLSTYRRTDGVDGYVSLEVSPELAYDTSATIRQAARLHHKADRPNFLIKIPGTPAGLPAIEESIFSGVPVNVTLLFTPAQYAAAAEAYMLGLERRLEAGLDVSVPSVASLFVSRWDVAVADRVPDALRNRLGVAIGRESYRAYRELLESDRWQRLANFGARPQRLLFASTGVKDPEASDILYVRELASPNTVNTMPEATLLAFADHGVVDQSLPRDGGDAAEVLAAFEHQSIDIATLGQQLQDDGAAAFVSSWRQLIERIGATRPAPAPTR